MTHTVTVLADHKGFTGPKVSGDEYYVDAVIDVTSYAASQITPTVTFAAGTTNNITGDTLEGVTSGQEITIASAATSSNSGAHNGTFIVLAGASSAQFTLTNLDGSAFTAVAETDDEITVSHTNEVVNASSFGLSKINKIEVTGKELITYDVLPKISAAGAYLTDSSFELKAVTNSSGADVARTTNIGAVRVRVYGLV
jgi:hypothetical protein